MNNIKFKTPKVSRRTLEAQAIYWQWFKLKKLVKIKFHGSPPQLFFNRKQLPSINRLQTFDMDLYINNHQRCSQKVIWTTLFLLSYVGFYYTAFLLEDENFRYDKFVNYPFVMKIFDDNSQKIIKKKQEFYEKMNIKEFRDLQNKVGYTNLKEGIKKQIYGDMKEKKKEDEKQTKIEIKEADKMIKQLDKVLVDTDSNIIKQKESE